MSDQLKLLSLANLAELDDALQIDFDHALSAAAKDCLARPSIKKKRQVSIVVDLAPVVNQDGTCDDIRIDVQVAGKSPAKVVPTIVARATVNGGLKWNRNSPTNPDQTALDFDVEGGEVA